MFLTTHGAVKKFEISQLEKRYRHLKDGCRAEQNSLRPDSCYSPSHTETYTQHTNTHRHEIQKNPICFLPSTIRTDMRYSLLANKPHTKQQKNLIEARDPMQMLLFSPDDSFKTYFYYRKIGASSPHHPISMYFIIKTCPSEIPSPNSLSLLVRNSTQTSDQTS